MFYLDFGGHQIVGSSPEVHAKLQGDEALLRPIAGTRPRGATREKDLALEKELLADEKERAEHLMLIDLARNDVGRRLEERPRRVSRRRAGLRALRKAVTRSTPIYRQCFKRVGS